MGREEKGGGERAPIANEATQDEYINRSVTSNIGIGNFWKI